MAKTRTGSFPIGFRRGWTDWQKKDLGALARWAKAQDFEAIDLCDVKAQDIKTLSDNGLKIGSADLLDFGNLMANDEGKRKDVIAKNVAYVKEISAAGAKIFFTCIIPGDPSKKRADNYKLAVECYSPIAQACAQNGAVLAVEGWPGGAPWLGNLCCTPETCRAFLKDCGPGTGLNYDPSHLIRLGVDHIRFVKEFAPHIKHAHGKDTDLYPEQQYEYGSQGSAFAKPRGFGEWTWRYTIPGQGLARWNKILYVLKNAGYQGMICVELEDENFNTDEAGEKAGLTHSLAYLKGV